MINNNPYNIPEKKPLSQSKILSDTNTSRHSSTYLQNRNGNEMMYSSTIFLKNSSINGGNDQSFYEPVKQPLSPHHPKYSKPPATVQIVPTYNHPSMWPQQNHVLQVPTMRDNNIQKFMAEFKQKIQNIEKRLEARQRKQIPTDQLHNNKAHNLLQIESVKSLKEESLNLSNGLKQLISSMIQSSLESQNKRIWDKLSQIEENMAFSTNSSVAEKVSGLEQSILRLQSQKPHDQHLMNRLKTIQKTIREMGEDIHLVNDKEEGLSAKIQNDLPTIRNEIKSLKCFEKKIIDTEKKSQELKNEVEELSKKLMSLEINTQANVSAKIKEVQFKIQSLKSHSKDIKPSFQRYFSQPSVVKYIEKYQVYKTYSNYHSYSSSTKEQSCEQIILNQITYFIDHQGYLLDNNRHYLTNGVRNDRIRLDAKHIEILRQKKILI